MLESLGLSEQDVVILATGLGTFIASIMIAIRGTKKGTPTSTAVAAAVANATPMCRLSVDLAPLISSLSAELQKVQEQLAAVERVQERNRETLIRIEDRTKRS
ncbi:hypothetical protein ATO6_15305 [Oceanicola sp. 22II-s10i]|uniref:hypothetical protein n=1 Tax=Oceanicola sp. 22II-s10i TaxID=1317116 RepID=UPI000B520C03|nr:hypothetical protein [Oceanicola sp. 22II-s10i]OWU83798.1 hypothetical protein ATO6_15305 [Oceanicola sp. 22II-s10i]